MPDSWFQEVLFQAEVIEVNVRWGMIPDVGHGQWLVEVKDPTDGRLIDQVSVPHFPIERWLVEVDALADQLRRLAGAHLEPF